MKQLLKELTDLVAKYENEGLVPKDSNYYLTPYGSRIDDEDDQMLCDFNESDKEKN